METAINILQKLSGNYHIPNPNLTEFEQVKEMLSYCQPDWSYFDKIPLYYINTYTAGYQKTVIQAICIEQGISLSLTDDRTWDECLETFQDVVLFFEFYETYKDKQL